MKLVALLKFRKGLSREEGIAYYEGRHVPLAERHLGRFISGYRRSFVEPDAKFFPDHMEGTPPPMPNFDIMTEMWFDSREQFDAMSAALADPDIGAEIAADEENVFDRSAMVMFMVDERISNLAKS